MNDFGWFEKMLTVSGTYLPDIKRDVQALMEEYDLKCGEEQPKKYLAYKVSSTLIKRAAFKTAGIGGLTSVPAVLPLVGSAGTVLVGSAVDLYYLLNIQIELCYAVSVAYEAAMDEEELKAVTLAILGFSGSAEALKMMAAGGMRRAINEMAQRYLSTGLTKATSEVAERLLPRLLRRTFKFLPFLGIPLGASINIASTLMVGNQARRYFAVWATGELCQDKVKGLMTRDNDAL